MLVRKRLIFQKKNIRSTYPIEVVVSNDEGNNNILKATLPTIVIITVRMRNLFQS